MARYKENMTREQIKNMLIESGVEAPSNLLISALLDSFNSEKKQAVDEATKTATEKAQEAFKDYVKPDDYKKLQDEMSNLKDSSAKAERTAKYKAKGVSDKYLDFADSKLKDSKDFDKDLETFIKDNAELCGKAQQEKEQGASQPPQPKNFQFGGVQNQGGTAPQSYDMAKAVAEALNKK